MRQPLLKARQKAFKKRKELVGQFGDTQIVFSPPGQEKMSEVLDEFVAPYEQHISDRESYERLLMVAMVAWNAALVSGAGLSPRARLDLARGHGTTMLVVTHNPALAERMPRRLRMVDGGRLAAEEAS